MKFIKINGYYIDPDAVTAVRDGASGYCKVYLSGGCFVEIPEVRAVDVTDSIENFLDGKEGK